MTPPTTVLRLRIASVLPAIGIALAAANWHARPEAAWAWTAAIVMLAVMLVVRHGAARRATGDATSRLRAITRVSDAVIFGALMVIVPLGATLARAYGVLPEGEQRAAMIILGALFIVSGNAMPRMLPPLSSMRCNGSRIQAFQRLAGWMWVLCGIGWSAAWLVLPIDAARTVSVALVVGTAVLMLVQILRLRRHCEPAPGLQ